MNAFQLTLAFKPNESQLGKPALYNFVNDSYHILQEGYLKFTHY